MDCVAALAGGVPGFLCRILGRRRALRQARTKSELLLARLRRSWHIRLQWNSCGCRRRLRPARPTLKKSRSFQSGRRPPRSSPSLVPRCREPQKAADYATSGASASRERLVERWIRAALAMTGERFRPAFFAVFSVAAAPCAKLEQKVNFCLHAYAVHGIYVYSGIRMAAGGGFARPAPPSENPVPSEAAHALPSLHPACRATSRFALFLPRLLLFATF